GSGFDSLGLTLEIVDTVRADFTPDNRDVVLAEVTGDGGAAFDPADNPICEAYHSWAAETGIELPGVRFALESRIPPARGLGSSAAYLAAGLAAAAHVAADKDPRRRMLDLATRLEGHPDNVAAAIMGGMSVAFRDGDETRALHVANHRRLDVVLF